MAEEEGLLIFVRDIYMSLAKGSSPLFLLLINTHCCVAVSVRLKFVIDQKPYVSMLTAPY